MLTNVFISLFQSDIAMYFVSLLIYLVNLCVREYDAARILAVFPVPSISHQVAFRPLTQELARRGHELVILTTDPAFKDDIPQNIIEINLHDESYKIWREGFVKKMDGKLSKYDIMKIGFNLLRDIVEVQLQNKEVQNLIRRKEKFDLIFIEACVRSALVITHVFKAPVIQISSLGALIPNYIVHGAPTHPLLYPETMSERVYNLTLWEKIDSIYFQLRLRFLASSLEEKENEMFKRHFGSDAPNVQELSNNVDMLFLNMDRIWEGNIPVPPGVIHLGGLHLKPEKPLPKDLEAYLNSSVHGVIYMSFGTNVQPSLLPPEKIQAFMNVFAKLPYEVMLKWDKHELVGKPNNVRLFKWIPQSDLLRHPKIKLFITQAGLQSTDEAINAGVPLIAFPMFADQWYNAEKYVHFKIGKKFHLATITEDVLNEAISTVIADGSYRSNIVKLRTLMHDQPQSSLERAVWWTEHVLRHGGARHLRAPAANMGWWQYLALDVLSVLFVLLLITMIIAIRLFYYVFVLLCNNDITIVKFDKKID